MKKLLLVSICSAVLLCVAGQVSSVSASPMTGTRRLVKFLSPHNEALDKALRVHNLMTEIPGLQVLAVQQTRIRDVSKAVKNYHAALMKCNEKRFGRFSNSQEVLAKVRAAYGERTKQLEVADTSPRGVLAHSSANSSKLYLQKKAIEQELVTEALTDNKKWGGKSVDQQPRPLPENLTTDIKTIGLEELALAEQGLNNVNVAVSDYDAAFVRAQQDFVRKLEFVGLSFPDFNAARNQDIRQVKEALRDLKNQYLADAEAYIVKLDEQDAAYPEAVARREARSRNKKVVLKQVQELFPDEFAEMNHFDQRTPQDRQRVMITAMQKDKEGTVFLTETNALEIDQLIAERKSTENLIDTFQAKSVDVIKEMQTQYPDVSQFDFSHCSG